MEIEYIDLQTKDKRMGIVEGKYIWLWSLPLCMIMGVLLALIYLS